MGFLCNVPRDFGCAIWNDGESCKSCVNYDCLCLVETYDFRRCDCGSGETPKLYGEGVAKQYIEHKGDFEKICWSQFDGYVVECQDCDAVTAHFSTPEEAVVAWNEHRLYFNGIKT